MQPDSSGKPYTGQNRKRSFRTAGCGSSTGGSPGGLGIAAINAERSTNRKDKAPAIPALQRIQKSRALYFIRNGRRLFAGSPTNTRVRGPSFVARIQETPPRLVQSLIATLFRQKFDPARELCMNSKSFTRVIGACAIVHKSYVRKN